MRQLAAFTVVIFAALGAARAEVRTIVDNERELTIVCNEEDTVQVLGNENIVKTTGPCANVTVLGNENKVDVHQAAEITVAGNDNKVTWHQGPKGKDPKILSPGSRNVVQKK